MKTVFHFVKNRFKENVKGLQVNAGTCIKFQMKNQKSSPKDNTEKNEVSDEDFRKASMNSFPPDYMMEIMSMMESLYMKMKLADQRTK